MSPCRLDEINLEANHNRPVPPIMLHIITEFDEEGSWYGDTGCTQLLLRLSTLMKSTDGVHI